MTRRERQRTVEKAARKAAQVLAANAGENSTYALCVRAGTSSGIMFNVEAEPAETATAVLDILRTFIQILPAGPTRDQFINYAHCVLDGYGPSREFSVRTGLQS